MIWPLSQSVYACSTSSRACVLIGASSRISGPPACVALRPISCWVRSIASSWARNVGLDRRGRAGRSDKVISSASRADRNTISA